MENLWRDFHPNLEYLLFCGRQPNIRGPGLGCDPAMPVFAEPSFNPGPVLGGAHSARESPRSTGGPLFDIPVRTLQRKRICWSQFPSPIMTPIIDRVAGDKYNDSRTGHGPQEPTQWSIRTARMPLRDAA